ncbi:signal recognition particle, SRP9/SRP14 subunit [Patellaria atrata CBS 101060]|uniref:Signal recognition particle subunit SRP14 n=1 Tax=Patellaria atrata CBS 101060 TaxID=1346257 RepID=A0A9P4S2S6_9PEZI|nr:signal recognition particle, SRP9/SRP14 subunit [Patellaria atrata CBS 101060]
MSNSHLSNEEFFSKLSELLDSRRDKDHGSIYLTQKRLAFDLSSAVSTPTKVTDDPLWDLHPPNPLPIIIRATNGKSKEDRAKGGKIKLSTLVQPDDLEGFYTKYAEICKAGMQALKKRVRTKRKKDKAKKKKAVTAGEGEKKG